MVFVLLLAFALVVPSLHAQVDASATIGVGGAYSFQSSTFNPLPGIPIPSDTLTFTGNNIGMPSFYLSVGAEGMLRIYSDFRLGVAIRGVHFNMAPSFDARERVPIARDGQVFNATLTHHLATEVQVLGGELGIRGELWNWLGVEPSVWVRQPLEKRYSQTMRFIDPEGIRFVDGSLERLTARGETPGMGPAFGLGLRLDAAIRLTDEWKFVSTVAYSQALQSMNEFADWKPTTYAFNLGLRYTFFSTSEPDVYIRPTRTVTTRDTVVALSINVEAPRTDMVQRTIDSVIVNDTLVYNVFERYRTVVPKQPSLLRVSVKVGFEQTDGSVTEDARLVSTRMQRTRIVPLLPVVVFDATTNRIPERYKTLTQRDAQRWTEQRLRTDTGAHWQYHVLNIIGSRMKRNASAVMEIQTQAEDNAASLDVARQRAQSVQQYLADVFRIPTSRLPIVVSTTTTAADATNSEQGNATWVYLRDVKGTVATPISMQDTITESQLPRVRIVPEILSEAGLASWNVQLMHRGRALRSYGDKSSIPSAIQWDMREDVTMDAVLQAPVVVEIAATDLEGTTVKGEPGRISLQGSAVTDASARLSLRKEVLLVHALDNLRTPDAQMLPVPGEFRRTIPIREGGWFRKGLEEPELLLYRSASVYLKDN